MGNYILRVLDAIGETPALLKKIEEQDVENGQEPFVEVLVGPASSTFVNGPDSLASSEIINLENAGIPVGAFQKPAILSWEEIKGIFGAGIKESLAKEKPKKSDLFSAFRAFAEEFWKDKKVLSVFANEDVNAALEIVRSLVQKNFGLQGLSLQSLTKVIKENAPAEYRSKVLLQYLSVSEYVFFVTGLKSKAMQDYLDSVVWDEVLPLERIFLILQKMQEIGIPMEKLDRTGMDVYASALPNKVFKVLMRFKIVSTEISFYVMEKIREAFAGNDELQAYVRSDKFIFTPKPKKNQALFEKLKELNIIPDTQRLSEDLSGYLGVKLGEQIFADDELTEIIQRENMFGKKAIGWLKRHQIAIPDTKETGRACEQLLSKEDFRAFLKDKEKISPISILRLVIKHDIFLGTLSLRSFIEALRAKVAEVSKENSGKIKLSSLTINDYVAFVAGLEHPKIKEFLHGDFQLVKEPYRMFMLLRELQKLGICFSSEAISNFHAELPVVFSDNVEKRSIRSYQLNVSEVAAMKSIFDHDLAVLMAQKDFPALEKNEKIAKIYKLYRAEESPEGQAVVLSQDLRVFLEDVLNNFEVEDSLIKGLRAKIFDEGVEDFMVRHKPIKGKANDYGLVKDAAKAFHEDKGFWEDIKSGKQDFPTALIRFAIKQNIHLGTSYVDTFIDYYRAAFPEDLKDAQVSWRISFKDFINLRAYLIHPAIERFINEDLRRWPPWERLSALLEKMEEFGLMLENEDLGAILGVLPNMLTPDRGTSGFLKEEMRDMPFVRKDFLKIEKDFQTFNLKPFLLTKDIREKPLEEKVVAMWEQARKEGFFAGQEKMTRKLMTFLTWLIRDFEVDHSDAELKRKRVDSFGKNVHRWMKRHHVRSGGIPWRMEKTAKQFWDDVKTDEFFRENLEKNKESIHLLVVRHIIGNDYDLGTPSLRDFFTELRKTTPQGIAPDIEKRFRITTDISVNEFINFYSGIFHSKVQQLLYSPEFLKIPKHIRLVYLWEYMKDNNLPVPPGARFEVLLPILPSELGNGITRKDFGSVRLNIDSVNAIRSTVLRLEKLVTSPRFKSMDANERVEEFSTEATNEGLSLGGNLEDQDLRNFLSRLLTSVADEGTVAKSSFSEIDSITGTILDPNNKNGVWEEVSPTEVRLKSDANLKKNAVRKIAKGDFDKVWAILQQSHDGMDKALGLEVIKLPPLRPPEAPPFTRDCNKGGFIWFCFKEKGQTAETLSEGLFGNPEFSEKLFEIIEGNDTFTREEIDMIAVNLNLSKTDKSTLLFYLSNEPFNLRKGKPNTEVGSILINANKGPTSPVLQLTKAERRILDERYGRKNVEKALDLSDKVMINEITRDPKAPFETQNQMNYLKNQKDVRMAFLKLLAAMIQGKIQGPEKLKEEIRKLHIILMIGADRKTFYVPPTFPKDVKEDTAVFFKENPDRKADFDNVANLFSEEIVGMYKGQHARGYAQFYAALNMERMRLLFKGLSDFVSSKKSPEQATEAMKEFYFDAMGPVLEEPFLVSAQIHYPFEYGNNSLFFNMGNTMLRLGGLNGVSHGNAEMIHVLSKDQAEPYMDKLSERIKDANPQVELNLPSKVNEIAGSLLINKPSSDEASISPAAENEAAVAIQKPAALSWKEIEDAFDAPGIEKSLNQENPKDFHKKFSTIAEDFWRDKNGNVREEIKKVFDRDDADGPRELVRFLVQNNIGLKNLFLRNLIIAVREKAPKEYLSKVPFQYLSMSEYIFFFAGIKSQTMQDYLDSIVWDEVLPHERIFLILTKMEEMGIPCERPRTDVYNFAMPYHVSKTLMKKMIPTTEVSLQTLQRIHAAFASKNESNADSEDEIKKAELKKYLSSDEFIFTPNTEKRKALFAKLKRLGIVRETQTLKDLLNSYLGAKLAEQIFANQELADIIQHKLFGEKAGKKAIGWLKRHQGAVGDLKKVDEACQRFLDLDNQDFRDALKNEETIYPLRILQIAMENDISLGTSNLRIFVNALRKKVAQKVSKEAAAKIRTLNLTISDYVAFMAGLEHPKIQEFVSGDFQLLKEPYRIFTLLTELQRSFGICFFNESETNFYAELPAAFFDRVPKGNIRYYFLNIPEIAAIKNILTPEVLALLLADTDFQRLGEEGKIERMYALLNERKKMSGDSAVPAFSEAKIFLGDLLRNFETEDNTATSRREEIFGKGVEAFLVNHKPIKGKANDYGLIKKAAEAFHKDKGFWDDIKSGKQDLPTALIRFAVKQNIRLGTSYVRIFIQYYREAFPEDLTDEQIFWDISFKDFINLRAYLADPGIQTFIDKDLHRWPPWERLEVLVEKMKESGLVLESEFLRDVTGSLPKMLTPQFLKTELRAIYFSRLEYYQIKEDFSSLVDQRILLAKSIRRNPIEEKIKIVIELAKRQGLALGKKDMSKPLADFLRCLIQDFEIDHSESDLKQSREKIFGKNVHNWMKRHHEYLTGIPGREVMTAKQLWKDPDFLQEIKDRSEPVYFYVVKHAIKMENDFDLGTSSLEKFFDVLKDNMPDGLDENIKKQFRDRVDISVNDFINFYSGIFHPKIQEFLQSPQFLKIPKYIRLVYLWEYMKANKLSVPPGRFVALFSLLPSRLTKGFDGKDITQQDFSPVTINIASVKAIRKAVKKLEVFIESKEFGAMDKYERVYVFLSKVKDEKLFLDINWENRGIRPFLANLLTSAGDDGIDQALGLEKNDDVSEKAPPTAMNNGNGVPAKQHVVTLLPADFLTPLDFNGRGSLIILKR
ncbi:MAG: hypothetical protein NT079_05685 [Candidatus Omnitrophica bacterium]|nr:hypothetical protein [Candidatus Omnitrophota bacterium]